MINPRPTPIIGQSQAQAQAAIQAAIQQLSMGIYSRLAVKHLEIGDDVTPAAFEAIAKDAMTAAKGYFVGLGILKESEGNGEA